MSKIKTIVTGGFMAAIVVAVVTTAVVMRQPNAQNIRAVQGAQTGQQQNDTYVSFVATKGKNVLEQLKEHATVEAKDSQYGPFVDAINGKKQDGKFWSFYVDGQMAQVGAAEYITQGGEKIEWKLE